MLHLSAFAVWLFFLNPIKIYYTYCGSVRPVVAWEFWCPEFGKIHIIDTKLSSWLQMFCVFGGEWCNWTVTDQSYSYCGFYLAFFVSQYCAIRLFVMTSAAIVQSDTEVLLLVTSVMVGGIHGPNRLLEVDQNTPVWNVTVGLILL
jgi:hypothetical protein